MDHYQHLTLYILSTRGTRVTDTYVLIPKKFNLQENAAADTAITDLEEFFTALNNPKTKKIPFLLSVINKAVNALSDLLSPKRPTTEKIVAPPRVAANIITQPPLRIQNKKQALPRLYNNHNIRRKLQPQPQPIPHNYSRGTTVYKNIWNKYYGGYICDYNSKDTTK